MEETPIPFARPSHRPDPTRVRRAWQRCGVRLTDPETLVAQVGQQLLIRLEEIKGERRKILNFGERSGHLTQALRHRWPKATVVAATLSEAAADHAGPRRGLLRRHRLPSLLADDTALPFPRDRFDVVLSNMALHWSGHPQATLREIRRVLRPGGLLLLSLPGSESLQELKQCLAEQDQERWGKVWPRVPAFPTMQGLGDLLASSGLIQPVADRDPIQAAFADPLTLLRSLKATGAGNHHRHRPPGLMPRGYLKAVSDHYRQQYGLPDGRIQVSMEILFGHAWKRDPSRPEEATTSPCSLPGRDKF